LKVLKLPPLLLRNLSPGSPKAKKKTEGRYIHKYIHTYIHTTYVPGIIPASKRIDTKLEFCGNDCAK
jgi:hypothetical protein